MQYGTLISFTEKNNVIISKSNMPQLLANGDNSEFISITEMIVNIHPFSIS